MIVVHKWSGQVENTERRYGIGWKDRPRAIYRFYKTYQAAMDALRDLGDQYEYKGVEEYLDVVSADGVVSPHYKVVTDPQHPHEGFVNGEYVELTQ